MDRIKLLDELVLKRTINYSSGIYKADVKCLVRFTQVLSMLNKVKQHWGYQPPDEAWVSPGITSDL